MSSAGVTLTGNNYHYNFTEAMAKAHGGSAGFKLISPGVYGMVGGDPDADHSISVLDFSEWATNFGVDNVDPLKGLKINPQGNESPLRFKSQVPD